MTHDQRATHLEQPAQDSTKSAYSAEAIASHLSTTLLGRLVEFHEQVGSTNDLVKEAARNGAPEGLVIVAEEQISGRGRLGRNWVAPPGTCVLCSVLLRPRFLPQHAFYLTITASLAIYRAVKKQASTSGDECPFVASIKWPNDVLLNGRKMSGVLSESEFSGGEWSFAVVGFGININLTSAQLGPLSATATSLLQETGQQIDRAVFLSSVLYELEELYLLLQNGQFSTVYAQWAQALETVGKTVRVVVPQRAGPKSAHSPSDEIIEGKALRVESDGALIVRTEDGQEKRVLAGDLIPR